MEWTTRRHNAVFGVAALLAVLATLGFAMQRSPMWSSSTAVVVSSWGVSRPPNDLIGTEALIADSRPVLLAASERYRAQSYPELVRHVKVTVASPSVLLVTVTGWTGAGAQRAARAVAGSYVDFAMSPAVPGGPVQAVLDPATPATRTSVSAWVAETAEFGTLVGLVLGVIAGLTLRRAPRRRAS